MDGLRELAGSCPEFPLDFEDQPDTEFPAFSIESTPEGLRPSRGTLRQHELPRYFEETSGDKIYPLRLTCVGMGAPGRTTLKINSQTFREVLLNMQVDPWVEHLIRNQTYGFYHTGHPSTDEVASYVLKIRHLMAVWTCRRESAGNFTAKCLVIDSGNSPAKLLGDRIGLERYLRVFQNEAHSALYVPFVFAVNGVRWMEHRLERIMGLVRRVEARTGHGTWGLGRFEEKRESIPNLTAAMATELNVVAVLPMHLRTIESAFHHLELLASHESEAKNEHLRVTEASMLKAMSILRQECASVIQRCAVVEVRIRSQSSVLFAFLTHEDSKINIEIANTSKALAEATRRDGSSMKTVAVLTMAFLPATFLAALFSIPSLGWDQPDKFSVYWACTIPTTIFIFGLWAALTNRQAVLGLARQIRPLKSET